MNGLHRRIWSCRRILSKYRYDLPSPDEGLLNALFECVKLKRLRKFIRGQIVALAKALLRRIQPIVNWLQAVNPCFFRGWKKPESIGAEADKREWTITDSVWKKLKKRVTELLPSIKGGRIVVELRHSRPRNGGWEYHVSGILFQGYKTMRATRVVKVFVV